MRGPVTKPSVVGSSAGLFGGSKRPGLLLPLTTGPGIAATGRVSLGRDTVGLVCPGERWELSAPLRLSPILGLADWCTLYIAVSRSFRLSVRAVPRTMGRSFFVSAIIAPVVTP